MDIVLIIAGLVLLFIGGEALVRGSVTLSSHLGVSKLLIGVVVVGFGTSAPELLVSIKASLQGKPDIAVGNVVGSNIANILLILGVSSLLQPIFCKDAAMKRDAITVFCASVFLLCIAFFGEITRGIGIVMVLMLVFYLFYSYKAEKKEKALISSESSNTSSETLHTAEAEEFMQNISITLSVVMSVTGIVMLMFGADFLVDGASNIATRFGVSQATIGLSIVALGTSLPEIATAISASLKKESDVIIGNVLGSNLFNILSILGVTSIITPISISQQLAYIDIPIALAVAVIALYFINVRQSMGRLIGVGFLGLYGAYMAWLALSSAG